MMVEMSRRRCSDGVRCWQDKVAVAGGVPVPSCRRADDVVQRQRPRCEFAVVELVEVEQVWWPRPSSFYKTQRYHETARTVDEWGPGRRFGMCPS